MLLRHSNCPRHRDIETNSMHALTFSADVSSPRTIGDISPNSAEQRTTVGEHSARYTEVQMSQTLRRGDLWGDLCPAYYELLEYIPLIYRCRYVKIRNDRNVVYNNFGEIKISDK